MLLDRIHTFVSGPGRRKSLVLLWVSDIISMLVVLLDCLYLACGHMGLLYTLSAQDRIGFGDRL